MIKFIVIAAIIVIGLIFVIRRFGRARIEPQQKRLAPPIISTDGGAVAVESDGQEIQIDPATMAQIRALLAADRKIEAIKVLREATGLGLAEAKNLAESLADLKK